MLEKLVIIQNNNSRPMDEIKNAKGLLDMGAITEDKFRQLKINI